MTGLEIAGIGVAIIVGLILLFCLVRGFILFWAWALEGGFIGFAVFVAAWIFVAPITATLCVVRGMFPDKYNNQ